MKVSMADRNSKDVNRQLLVQHCTIYFNGEKIDDAVLADEDEGYVMRYVRGFDGKIARHPRTKMAMTERHEGIVEIKVPEWLAVAFKDAK